MTIKTLSRRYSLKIFALGSLFGLTRSSSLAQEKSKLDRLNGFGLVTIDTKARTYHIDSFRFQIDATDFKTLNQFLGWPVTINQSENSGENKLR